MAISATERRNQDDRVRETREEADQRERDLIKRKNSELKRADQRHQAEMKRISEDYQNQLGSTKDRYRESLSARDHRHQQQIDEVKDLYRGQLKKRVEDGADEKQALRDTFQNDMDKQKTIGEGQRKQLVQKQQDELERRDSRLNELHAETRTEMQDTVKNNTEKLRRSYDKEKNVLEKDRENLISQKDIERGALKEYYKEELSREKRGRESEGNAWKQKYYDTVKNLQSLHQEDIAAKGEILDGQLALTKARYHDKLNDNIRQTTGVNEDYRSTVEDRIDGQVRSRDSQIQRLQTKLNTEMANNSRLRGLERRNLQTAFQSQINLLESQKDEQRENLNELNAKRITDANDRNSGIMRDGQRRHKSEMSLKSEQYRQSVDSLNEVNKTQLERTQQLSKLQNSRITKISHDNEMKLGDYYDQTLSQAKDNFSDRLIDQRVKNDEDFAKITTDMNQKFRNIESRFSERMDRAVSKYEAKINELTEKNKSDVNRVEGQYQAKLESQEKANKQDRASLEMKYEARLNLQKQQHDEQSDKLNERHQEEMKTLATKMNSYNRKA